MTYGSDKYKCLGCGRLFDHEENVRKHWDNSLCKPCGHTDCQCQYMDEVEFDELMEQRIKQR